MDESNITALLGFIMSSMSLLAYMYCTRKQIIQTLAPKDWLTNFRYVILGVLITGIVGIIPVVIYQGLRTFGIESEQLRGIATITGNVSRLATAFLFVLVYRYKINDK